MSKASFLDILSHEFTQWNRTRGEDNRKNQRPHSKIKFKKTAGGAACSESDHRWKSQANTASGSSDIWWVAFTLDEQGKIDRQLGYVCRHHRGRRKSRQLESDQRILCCHGGNADHADRYCNSAVRVGERTEPGAEREESHQETCVENQQCSPGFAGRFVCEQNGNYAEHNDEHRY